MLLSACGVHLIPASSAAVEVAFILWGLITLQAEGRSCWRQPPIDREAGGLGGGKAVDRRRPART